jgi:phosphatidylethanolamine-binding protein (PEBP) family uncharacterized protein
VPTWLMLAIAIPAVGAIFVTTPAGRRLINALGIRLRFGGGPPPEDHQYLLRVCGGDKSELARRLDDERARQPDLSEAQLYRQAIRTYMNSRDPASS